VGLVAANPTKGKKHHRHEVEDDADFDKRANVEKEPKLVHWNDVRSSEKKKNREKDGPRSWK
jgi:hypothetical protein